MEEAPRVIVLLARCFAFVYFILFVVLAGFISPVNRLHDLTRRRQSCEKVRDMWKTRLNVRSSKL